MSTRWWHVTMTQPICLGFWTVGWKPETLDETYMNTRTTYTTLMSTNLNNRLKIIIIIKKQDYSQVCLLQVFQMLVSSFLGSFCQQESLYPETFSHLSLSQRVSNFSVQGSSTRSSSSLPLLGSLFLVPSSQSASSQQLSSFSFLVPLFLVACFQESSFLESWSSSCWCDLPHLCSGQLFPVQTECADCYLHREVDRLSAL